ncbi:exopolyphosphatase / guanosine-5'-triphosphate,3'-diphosphate pyrophosphatase [Lachnospiraceae bacterium]|nr:exopolyphosphatase / guanosine-5'-triphosphate,3'-diphosphate pyrophosphatase [Lachnospiraceae bacterium]
MKLFAAIDVGSYEIGMKIFELSQKRGVKEIDYVRHRVEIGTDTYNTGKISYDRMDELCEILKGYHEIMNTYKVDAYRAYGTSAIRETENTAVILDQIRLRTGINVFPLSNSEQRFLDYKSVALKSDQFDHIIDRGTAFVDIGGGSTQVSLFSNSHLNTTVNLRLGILKLRTTLNSLEPTTGSYDRLLSELISNELHSFKKLYLRNLDIQNIVVIDDYLPYIIQKIGGDHGIANQVTGDQYVRFVDVLRSMSPAQVSRELGIPRENASLLMPSAALIKYMIRITGAERLWIPGVTLSDGIAYDYAEKNKFVRSDHNFEEDIISCAENISVRYQGSQALGDQMVQCALAVFDSMKKLHGMDKRGRLLLQLAARLRDVGRFVSMSDPAETSYSIIMGTEIIGLSHLEREIVATVVLNSYPKEIYYEALQELDFDEKSILTVTKLTAILRVAAGMARSPRKKYNDVKAVIKDKSLIVTIDTREDLSLEKGLFDEEIPMFEEVFGIRPVMRTKGGMFE